MDLLKGYEREGLASSDWERLKLREPTVLCDHLEGWDREGGREGDARGKRHGNILYMYN